jgi:hypothetical protein
MKRFLSVLIIFVPALAMPLIPKLTRAPFLAGFSPDHRAFALNYFFPR